MAENYNITPDDSWPVILKHCIVYFTWQFFIISTRMYENVANF